MNNNNKYTGQNYTNKTNNYDQPRVGGMGGNNNTRQKTSNIKYNEEEINEARESLRLLNQKMANKKATNSNNMNYTQGYPQDSRVNATKNTSNPNIYGGNLSNTTSTYSTSTPGTNNQYQQDYGENTTSNTGNYRKAFKPSFGGMNDTDDYNYNENKSTLNTMKNNNMSNKTNNYDTSSNNPNPTTTYSKPKSGISNENTRVRNLSNNMNSNPNTQNTNNTINSNLNNNMRNNKMNDYNNNMDFTSNPKGKMNSNNNLDYTNTTNTKGKMGSNKKMEYNTGSGSKMDKYNNNMDNDYGYGGSNNKMENDNYGMGLTNNKNVSKPTTNTKNTFNSKSNVSSKTNNNNFNNNMSNNNNFSSNNYGNKNNNKKNNEQMPMSNNNFVEDDDRPAFASGGNQDLPDEL